MYIFALTHQSLALHEQWMIASDRNITVYYYVYIMHQFSFFHTFTALTFTLIPTEATITVTHAEPFIQGTSIMAYQTTSWSRQRMKELVYEVVLIFMKFTQTCWCTNKGFSGLSKIHKRPGHGSSVCYSYWCVYGVWQYAHSTYICYIRMYILCRQGILIHEAPLRRALVAVLRKNSFDRELCYWITASEEYKEYEENKNGRFGSSFICSRSVFACLQGQLQCDCSVVSAT